MAYLSVIVEFV